ncbi:MAG: glutathione S-transferase [Pseudomonadota bacterium]
MKLLYSGASPFVAKVRMAARFAGVDVEAVSVDAVSEDPVLIAANPLAKIPCLVTDEGIGVYDSRAIMRYLDRASGGKLFPSDPQVCGAAEILEATCDGISDCAVAYMYEMRFRPEEKWHQPWLDRQWGKVSRALDHLEASPDLTDQPMNAGTIALAACLGYLDLRFAGKWEAGHDRLRQWQTDFANNWPDYHELKPSA